jgi:hypothetical protein
MAESKCPPAKYARKKSVNVDVSWIIKPRCSLNIVHPGKKHDNAKTNKVDWLQVQDWDYTAYETRLLFQAYPHRVRKDEKAYHKAFVYLYRRWLKNPLDEDVAKKVCEYSRYRLFVIAMYRRSCHWERYDKKSLARTDFGDFVEEVTETFELVDSINEANIDGQFIQIPCGKACSLDTTVEGKVYVGRIELAGNIDGHTEILKSTSTVDPDFLFPPLPHITGSDGLYLKRKIWGDNPDRTPSSGSYFGSSWSGPSPYSRDLVDEGELITIHAPGDPLDGRSVLVRTGFIIRPQAPSTYEYSILVRHCPCIRGVGDTHRGMVPDPDRRRQF